MSGHRLTSEASDSQRILMLGHEAKFIDVPPRGAEATFLRSKLLRKCSDSVRVLPRLYIHLTAVLHVFTAGGPIAGV